MWTDPGSVYLQGKIKDPPRNVLELSQVTWMITPLGAQKNSWWELETLWVCSKLVLFRILRTSQAAAALLKDSKTRQSGFEFYSWGN